MLTAMYRLPYRKGFFLGNIFIYKNLHIEPFNYAIKKVCFDFSQPTWAAQLSEPVEVRALFYPTSTSFDVITL